VAYLKEVMKSGFRKHLLLVFSIALSAVLLFLAFRGVDWHSVAQIVAHARWNLLFVALLISPILPFLRSLRWRVLLNAQGQVGIATAFWANSAGYLGNSFLPGRAGELIRTLMISKRSNLTASYVLTTALAERASDLLFLITASSLALASLPGKPEWLTRASHTMTVVGVLALIALALIPKTERLINWVMLKLPVSDTIRVKLLTIAEQVRLGVKSLHHPARLMQFLLLTILIWTGDVLSAMLIAYILHLSLTFAQGLLLVTALGLSSAIPSAPGYVGVFQYVAVTVLIPFGFTRSDALSYILMLQALGYVVTSILGLLAVWQLNLSISSFRKNAEPEQPYGTNSSNLTV
jgi:uncharacterized protein (TIRG00374 family)